MSNIISKYAKHYPMLMKFDIRKKEKLILTEIVLKEFSWDRIFSNINAYEMVDSFIKII